MTVLLSLFTSLAVVFALMPWYIGAMRKLAWGQQIREDGPQDHLAKQGTPTMGGLVISLGVLAGFLWTTQAVGGWDAAMILFCVLGNTAIGFFDDFAKIRKKRNLGLTPRQKLTAQLAVGLVLAVYLVAVHPNGTLVKVPGYGSIHSAVLAFILAVVVMLSTTNAVNLTDGLDGLAGGTVAVAAAAYALIAWLCGRNDLAAMGAAMTGACVGFLYYNRYPARIFMGDTGSLALGGGLCALAVLTRTEWLLIWIGGVFVVEALSVLLQVSYFKLTKGKRIFRMSPFHHHLCRLPGDHPALLPGPSGGGWHETRVTSTLWMAGVILATTGIGLWYQFRGVWPGL